MRILSVQELVLSPTKAAAPSRKSTPALPLSRQAKRQLSKMMGQQFWLFGYDIRQPEGNILLDLGFEKCRPPEGSHFTTSRYVLRQPDALTVALWGFGMYVSEGDPGGLYISRNGISPLVHTCGDVLGEDWDPTTCAVLHAPVSPPELELARALLIRAIEWICSYEEEVARRFGPDRRREAIAAWKHAWCPAHRLQAEWTAVARHLAAISGYSTHA
jgi:hypothetical protein